MLHDVVNPASKRNYVHPEKQFSALESAPLGPWTSVLLLESFSCPLLFAFRVLSLAFAPYIWHAGSHDDAQTL